MKKKEWLNRAQQSHDQEISAFCNAVGYLSIILDGKYDFLDNEIEFSRGNKTLRELLETINESVDTMHQKCRDIKELSKGLIHSVPDDLEIREPMSMFE